MKNRQNFRFQLTVSPRGSFPFFLIPTIRIISPLISLISDGVSTLTSSVCFFLCFLSGSDTYLATSSCISSSDLKWISLRIDDNSLASRVLEILHRIRSSLKRSLVSVNTGFGTQGGSSRRSWTWKKLLIYSQKSWGKTVKFRIQ